MRSEFEELIGRLWSVESVDPSSDPVTADEPMQGNSAVVLVTVERGQHVQRRFANLTEAGEYLLATRSIDPGLI